MEKSNAEFTLQTAKSNIITFGILAILFLGVDIFLSLLYFIFDVTDHEKYLLALVCFILAFCLSLFGTYVFYQEKIEIRDRVLRYIKPYRATHEVSIEKVKYIYQLPYTDVLCKVLFLGSNGERFIEFVDDGTALKKSSFIKVIDTYQIKIINADEYQLLNAYDVLRD